MNEKMAVVSIGYNRPQSLRRLLDSLRLADYGGDRIDLVVSLDHSDRQEEAVRVAEQCSWPHGEKIIRKFAEKQGLRRHVLACGDLTETYDAVAVFEDDIVAAPGFYSFMKQTIEYYGEDDRIAGISLYSREWNMITDRLFEPQRSDRDVFFMQLAQSWGQVWTKNQLHAFKSWYREHENLPFPEKKLPQYIASWPANSWLKYHIWYCVDRDKYFVYPYTSLTTNFMEAGEHSRGECWRYQVAMQSGTVSHYRLQRLEDASAVKYDVFYENQGVAAWLGLPEEAVCVDLYGSKETAEGCRYWLTPRNADLPVARSFGLFMRPLEQNIQYNMEGDFFKLYRLPDNYIMPPPSPRKKKFDWVDYDIRGEGVRPRNILLWCIGCFRKRK